MDPKKWGLSPKKLIEILNRGSTADEEVRKRIQAKFGKSTQQTEEGAGLYQWIKQEAILNAEADRRISQELKEKYDAAVGAMLNAERVVFSEPSPESIRAYRTALVSTRKAHELLLLWDNRLKSQDR